jgi:hypothetical protein
MSKVKSFVVLGDSKNRDLAANVDGVVNAWLEKNPVENVEIAVHADLSVSYGRAFVVVKFENKPKEAAKK